MSISTVSLYLTEACNLQCRYCFLSKQPRRLPVEVGRNVVDFMLAAPPKVKRVSVYFFGGEPLLEFDTLKELTLYGRARAKELGKDLNLGVTTNGTLLTDEVIDFLFDQKISINFSVDGKPETQDANRKTIDGKGSFALLDAALAKVVERNPSQGVRMTYDSTSVGSLYQDHEYLWGRGITRTSPIAAFEDDWGEDDLARAGKQYQLIAQAVLERMRNGDLRRVGFLAKYAQRLAQNKRRMKQPCGICNGYIGVSVDGTVYPCQRFAACDGYPLGTLSEVTDVDARKLLLSYDSSRLPGCDDCPARMGCAGGCPAVNYVCTGEIYQPWPTQCAIIRMESETAKWLYERLVAGSNPLLDRLLGKPAKGSTERTNEAGRDGLPFPDCQPAARDSEENRPAARRRSSHG